MYVVVKKEKQLCMYVYEEGEEGCSEMEARVVEDRPAVSLRSR